MMLFVLGETKASEITENAIIKVISTKLKSLQAGKMGYSTTEVGDLVCEEIVKA